MPDTHTVESRTATYDGLLAPAAPAGRRPRTHGRDEAASGELLEQAAASGSEAERANGEFDSEQLAAFVQAVLAEDDTQASAFVDALRAGGATVESIYLDLLAPAARALGELWTDDQCDFVNVTIALGRMQLILRRLSHMFVRDQSDTPMAGRVLLSCVPGEQHSFGVFMVAEFFIRDGWGVRVGPPLSSSELLAEVRAECYDVIGFSVSCRSRLDHLKREIKRVRAASRNRAVLVMVGGRAFNDQPELVSRVGADASAMSAELAPARARQLLTPPALA